MSSFTLKQHNIPVTLPEGLKEEQLLSFHPFDTWVKTLTNSLSLQSRDSSHPFHSDPYKLKSITVQSFDLFGGSRLGFLKLTSDVSNSAGEKLPGSVFLRGPAVAMLVILIPDDAPPTTDERYVLLTVQPRIAAGSLAFVELPAGMVDDAGQFAGTAAKEIQEELGLEIPASELKCLSEMAAEGTASDKSDESEGLPQAVYPSPGGSDEYIPIYMHERRVPREQLSEWTGKLTGLRDEGEKITLKLVRMQDLWREAARDGKTLAALALWEGLRREGKL
ncbi:putative nudix domain-containing protein [Phaeoacremonium minimum UCRPA7]|uniref:Putative nudix domain-containing protein n=1 Tax=Phaeoacremonium minimum (strain UCR-PA7) TaxID=1286976 RepID=R8BQP5_PHAM7|nr:putative nudix domain-containing protein [Phaeoacremonium minimum UCRPA7]EOO01672.1 putative nudix domain-containing protein [Phaeoacremonium minimum UCRPA7]